MTERASIFEEEEALPLPPLNVAAFVPENGPTRPVPPPAEVEAAAARANFHKRPVMSAARKQAPTPEPVNHGPRRRTGRDHQFTTKIRRETHDQIIAVAAKHGWGLGECIEHAMEALAQGEKT